MGGTVLEGPGGGGGGEAGTTLASNITDVTQYRLTPIILLTNRSHMDREVGLWEFKFRGPGGRDVQETRGL